MQKSFVRKGICGGDGALCIFLRHLAIVPLGTPRGRVVGVSVLGGPAMRIKCFYDRIASLVTRIPRPNSRVPHRTMLSSRRFVFRGRKGHSLLFLAMRFSYEALVSA